TGRPSRGHARGPWPGVIVHDAQISKPYCTVRLRHLLRKGLTLLLAEAPEKADHATHLHTVHTAATQATDAPVTAYYLTDLDTAGTLTTALNPTRGEVWIVRPDAHIAAVVDGTDPTAV